MRHIGLVGRAALTAFIVSLLVLGAVALAAVTLESRADLGAVSDRLGNRAEKVVGKDPTTPAQAKAALKGAGHARIFGADGAVLAGRGSTALWTTEKPNLLTRLATLGMGGAAHPNAFELTAELPSGGQVAVREVVPTAHGGVGAGAFWRLGALALIGAVLIALGTALLARRAQRRLARLSHAAEAIGVSQRPALSGVGGAREWTTLARALVGASDRTDDFRAAAEVRFDALAAAITPLSMPVAARTPSGAIIRNAALDNVYADLNGGRADLDEAIAHSLADTGAVARRVPLSDGRTLDVDAWSVPGGRMVSVSDRTELQRAEELRARLAGGAMRTLRPPIAEIQAAAADLYRSVPASDAAPVQRILRSADRLGRLTKALLRGGPHDSDSAEVSRRAVGIAGLLWDAARKWDAGLKPRALRVELDVASGLPIADTDPALLEEILDELVENAAKFSRRGETISVSAELDADHRVRIGVRDTGDGFTPEVADRAADPFYRAPDADALPGTGLGLGVAKALAARIGAELIIEPGPVGGVFVTLPVSEPASGAVAA